MFCASFKVYNACFYNIAHIPFYKHLLSHYTHFHLPSAHDYHYESSILSAGIPVRIQIYRQYFVDLCTAANNQLWIRRLVSNACSVPADIVLHYYIVGWHNKNVPCTGATRPGLHADPMGVPAARRKGFKPVTDCSTREYCFYFTQLTR